ncbi:FolB domain-containing protein [Alkalitalea saponilacus]|uniref:Dihydroneopterin triphosphate 2'-epimerase n=1 Tax=Alkalitalea saponilacus TaxID=889453 RepID=A0A1T5HKQ4_9BACT|nr:FolB domain-containing protein [Alkalitalea saponilacus]ASB47788.1 dihydroneopterin triphosphate 2'-epimerase [Alkalitalea saponilacus]SKC21247.1 D-erythro-7,8-dihydroneopterin triphosphate epimerase [Alkalitalea saponilacus]
MAQIKIKNLLLRTQIGFNDHEIGKKQDLLLNIIIDYDLEGEEVSDEPNQALNYRTICKEVIRLVENGHFNLLERVAEKVASYIISIDRVKSVSLEVDKPHALRFAESVSFSLTKTK